VPLLELKNVSSAYGSVQALRGVSLRVEQGEIVRCSAWRGKKAPRCTISALIRARHEVWFEGKRIDTLAPEQIVRMGICLGPEGDDLSGIDGQGEHQTGPPAADTCRNKDGRGRGRVLPFFPSSASRTPWAGHRRAKADATARGLMAKPCCCWKLWDWPGDRAATLRHHPLITAAAPRFCWWSRTRICPHAARGYVLRRQHDGRRHHRRPARQRGGARRLSRRSRSLTCCRLWRLGGSGRRTLPLPFPCRAGPFSITDWFESSYRVNMASETAVLKQEVYLRCWTNS
jgi:hypothetical protein